jgi:hypothetical protein
MNIKNGARIRGVGDTDRILGDVSQLKFSINV